MSAKSKPKLEWSITSVIKASNFERFKPSPFRKLYLNATNGYWKLQDVDFDFEVDESNPLGISDDFVPLAGSDLWMSFDDAERARVRRHFQSWQLSQIIHGEYIAMVSASRIVLESDDPDEKACASLQAADEYKHLEVFKRLLAKFGPLYPPSAELAALFDEIVQSANLEKINLGMQVLVEGLALTFFKSIQLGSSSQNVRRIMSMISRDEARHFAAGQVGARSRALEASPDEIQEQTEFVIRCLHLLDHYLFGDDLWATIKLPADTCQAIARASPAVKSIHVDLFATLSQAIKSIGLSDWRIAEFFSAAQQRGTEM